MPACTPPLAIEGAPSMRVDIWNGAEELCFVAPGEKWIEVGNLGAGEFEVRLQAPEWVKLSEEQTVIRREKRILVRVSGALEDCSGEIVVENNSDGSLRRIPIRTVKTEAEKYGCAQEDDGLVVLEGSEYERWRTGALESGNSAIMKLPSEDFRLIRRLGRMQGSLVEAYVQGAKPLCYPFVTRSKGEFLLEIHRFPSLNSVGRLRIGISLDGGPVQVAESLSDDEWRGNWKKNVLNNVDRLYLKLSVSETGKHRLYVWAIDRYFAFSRMIIYTKPRKENNLAGIRGDQALPTEWDMYSWCDLFYGKYELPPRPVFYAVSGNGESTLAATCQVIQEEKFGRKIPPEWYLEQGKTIFEEYGGAIRIDAATVLAQSSCAWTEDVKNTTADRQTNGLWRHCGGESFGRSGLVMYIRNPELSWELEDAPSLNYRIRCDGGAYTLWMLSKFNVREEGLFGIGIDGETIPHEELYGKGSLWRYEAEQIYRWVPAVQVQLEKGEHVLHIYALASGMRYDRFYLTKGEELPPVDTEFHAYDK